MITKNVHKTVNDSTFQIHIVTMKNNCLQIWNNQIGMKEKRDHKQDYTSLKAKLSTSS